MGIEESVFLSSLCAGAGWPVLQGNRVVLLIKSQTYIRRIKKWEN